MRNITLALALALALALLLCVLTGCVPPPHPSTSPAINKAELAWTQSDKPLSLQAFNCMFRWDAAYDIFLAAKDGTLRQNVRKNLVINTDIDNEQATDRLIDRIYGMPELPRNNYEAMVNLATPALRNCIKELSLHRYYDLLDTYAVRAMLVTSWHEQHKAGKTKQQVQHDFFARIQSQNKRLRADLTQLLDDVFAEKFVRDFYLLEMKKAVIYWIVNKP